jgi:putative molybdopterin biosynthesis protein
MINRNAGSGTRVLIDQLLNGSKPSGYLIQTSNHRAVMAAIQQSRADWGIAIQSVVDDDTIGFLPIKDEHYDFMIANDKLQKESIQAFIGLLKDEHVKALLADINIETHSTTGELISASDNT